MQPWIGLNTVIFFPYKLIIIMHYIITKGSVSLLYAFIIIKKKNEKKTLKTNCVDFSEILSITLWSPNFYFKNCGFMKKVIS
jgi:hypothetical protein